MSDQPRTFEQQTLTTPDPDTGFRAPQVCSIVGITYRQLDHWIRTGLVQPSLAEAHGSGSQRRFDYRDLVELKVIKSLLDGGLALQSVRKVITYLRDDLGGDIASANIVINGAKSVVARSGEELIDLVRQGQGVLNIVPLGAVKDQVDAGILEFAPRLDAAGGAEAGGGSVAATGS